MVMFGYTAIWSYIRRAELRWHIQLSNCITGNPECHINLYYCALNNSFRREYKKKTKAPNPFRFSLELSFWGQIVGESKQNFQLFYDFHLKSPHSGQASSKSFWKWTGFSESSEAVDLHWNLKLNEMHAFDKMLCRDPVVAYGQASRSVQRGVSLSTPGC